MRKLSKINRNRGLLKALDDAKGFAKGFDLGDSPLRNKKAKAWLKRIGNVKF